MGMVHGGGRFAGAACGRPLLAALLTVTLAAGLASNSDAESLPARGKFLVASRALLDPNFAETVVLLLQYDDRGALGLVINHPTEVTPAELLPEVEGLRNYQGNVHVGGPVAIDNLTMLLRAKETPDEALHVFGDVYVTGNRKLLTQMAETGPDGTNVRVYVGYSGWGAGQLDYEIATGSWHIATAHEEFVFTEDSAGVWRDLLPPEQPLQAMSVP